MPPDPRVNVPQIEIGDQDRAIDYALGDLPQTEMERMESELSGHPDRARFVDSLVETSARMILAYCSSLPRPCAGDLKSRILGRVSHRAPSVITGTFGIDPDEARAHPLVVTNSDRFVEWVSPAFMDMCGYTMDELKGCRLGHILQGRQTDQESVHFVRQAVRRIMPVRQVLLNYHKNGSPYWVSLDIKPVFSPTGSVQAFVSLEQKVEDAPIP